MSVVSPATAEAFIYRVWKSLTSNPSVRWSNTYEARVLTTATSDDLRSLANNLFLFEQALAVETTAFLYITISTWLPDTHPYNPESFVTIPASDVGTRPISTDHELDLRVCLRLNRLPSSGRIGKIMLRNSLLAGDVVSGAGEFHLGSPGSISADVAAAMSAANLSEYFTTGTFEPKMAMIGSSEVTRFVENVDVGGVSLVKLNHKYFDRA